MAHTMVRPPFGISSDSGCMVSSTSNPNLRYAAVMPPERYSSRPTPDLPERCFSRPAPAPALGALSARLEHSTSLPSLSSSYKVRFEDLPTPNRPQPRWSFITSTTGRMTGKSPRLPPRPIPQSKENTAKEHKTEEVGESSKTSQILVPDVNVDTNETNCNPFADPADTDNFDDLPDLISPTEEDPFGDSHTTADSDNDSVSTTKAIQNLVPKIHIIDEDDALSFTSTPTQDADLKEDQAFFIAFDQFNHPNIARNQFRCAKGTLWDSAITILMNYYLHPSDLTENEFVKLACSQGNSTSKWLKDNARMISNRRIRCRMDAHRELTKLGIPVSQLTDEYLEIYQSMQESERKSFLAWFEELRDDVAFCENDLEIDDDFRERYMEMTFIEKADFIGLDNLKEMKRKRVERELDEIKKVYNHNLSTISTDSDKSFGESLERMNVHHSYPEEPLVAHSRRSKKLSSFKSASDLVGVVERITKDAFHIACEKISHSSKASTSSRGHSTNQNKFSFDSGIEQINGGTETTLSLPAGSSHGVFSRVKSGFFVNRKSYPPRTLKSVESRKDMKMPDFRSSSFDSDAVPLAAVGEDCTTAEQALFVAPKLVRVTPPSSAQSVAGTKHRTLAASVEEVPPCSLTENVPLASPYGSNKTVRAKKSVPKSLSSQSSDSTTAHRVFTEEAKDWVEDKNTLRSRSSHWTLHRRRSTIGDSDGKISKTKTLRTMISTIFGIKKGSYQERVSYEDNREEEPISRRKFYKRKSLPDWEFSK